MRVLTDTEVRWHFDDEAPRAQELLLLTIGGVLVTGPWTTDGRFLAWAPFPKVDKVALEKRQQELKERTENV